MIDVLRDVTCPDAFTCLVDMAEVVGSDLCDLEVTKGLVARLKEAGAESPHIGQQKKFVYMTGGERCI